MGVAFASSRGIMLPGAKACVERRHSERSRHAVGVHTRKLTGAATVLVVKRFVVAMVVVSW